MKCGQSGEGTRSSGHEKDARLASDAGVPVCGETGVEFVSTSNVIKSGTTKGIKGTQGMLSRHAKDAGRAKCSQSLNENVAASALVELAVHIPPFNHPLVSDARHSALCLSAVSQGYIHRIRISGRVVGHDAENLRTPVQRGSDAPLTSERPISRRRNF